MKMLLVKKEIKIIASAKSEVIITINIRKLGLFKID